MGISNLDNIFNPHCIAVAGVSVDMNRSNIGRSYVQSLLENGFRGRVYPVNPAGGEVYGLKVFSRVQDIPDEVDFVISAIPSRYTPQLLTDCISKGVKTVHLFTAGFSETGDEDGMRLEAELLRLARRNNIRIIGPNSLGLYCPATGLSFSRDFSGQPGFPRSFGPLGFMAQSGSNSIYCIREANARGVYFSKVVSYGNAVDLNECDFLEYLGDDPNTRIIGAYVEGVREGQRFIRVLRRVARQKPVIVFKAGVTESGTRAATSHTASLAGSKKVWETLLRQANVIQVHNIEEMVDVALLLVNGYAPGGNNAAIMGSGGGPSVQAADDCSNAGLRVPSLPIEVRRNLKDAFGTEIGLILGNPVDTQMSSEMFSTAVRLVADNELIDLIIIQVAFDIWSLVDRRKMVEPTIEAILRIRRVTAKPVVVVLHYQAMEEAKQLASQAHTALSDAGIPVYPSITRAATAVSRLIAYQARK